MIDKWVNFKRDYLEISFFRESGCVPFRRITDDIKEYFKVMIKSITNFTIFFIFQQFKSANISNWPKWS